MILGVGVDVLHIPRLRSLLARRDPAALARRILSRAELDEWSGVKVDDRLSERYLALRWTAKEATYKALYPHVKARWADLLVQKDGSKPLVRLSEDFGPAPIALSDQHQLRLHLSVSHDADVMIAYVIAEVLS
ncbi:holo-[acyl-carrier-protein] synthase [Rhodotorula toruloides]|uniref:Holo-[acyl-carrier-protein] synthase n=1 Tax=Rhodotorula toruloides TaxID=5286 RepID=A0A511KIT9_RHOTO|nr:holo-[acyl-carrier-protein] synthase [Rhodotorula toruloides]